MLLVFGAALLLVGVPAEGYLIGAGAWIALRAVGVVVDRVALRMAPSNAEIGLRLAYLLGRLFALAVTAVVVRSSVSKDDGLTVLLVVAFAFTVEFIISFIHRPRRR